jgi:acetoin utilization deacetylase AcuC-like enzyme
MLWFTSDVHKVHAPAREVSGGEFIAAVEVPARVEIVAQALRESGLGPSQTPTDHGLDPIRAVHSADYLDFLAGAFEEWRAIYGDRDAFPLIWPVRGLRQRAPRVIDGKLGYYSGDAGTAITAGTWQAAFEAAQIALSAAEGVVAGAPLAFALGRPPGHHAAADVYNGYCYLNNAAIAAEHLLRQGAGRVAILDVDYHHGNGTQDIFYRRGEVFFASIHADPDQEYPYFLGFPDETGQGAGEDTTLNLPLAWGTRWDGYARALDHACQAIARFAPDALVVSFGADTYHADPISQLALDTPDFRPMGARIAALGLPTVVIMEGGYAVDALGANTAEFLVGLSGG